MNLAYHIVRIGCKVVMNIFFKDLTVIGLENIPSTGFFCEKGPVIICGNHANQFLDAGLILSSVPRKVGFIVAAKSYRKKLVGTIAKALKALPVERSQDIAKEGTGKIIQINENSILGSLTKFTTEVKVGDTLKIKDIPAELIVKRVISDTELTFTTTTEIRRSETKLPYKIMPKLDQTVIYDAVWQRLKKGGCIGIFPEGGSHDQTQMLPLKAGICIMALGAMAKSSKPVKIVPCGLNYFKGYNFRSKAIVEFGVPYEIPISLLDLYLKNKKEAIATLLIEIENRMKSVTITAPSYNELSSVYLSRKLYLPARFNLTLQEEHLLNQTLAHGYNELKNDVKVKNLFDEIRRYHQELRKSRLEDSAVKRISSKDWKNVLNSMLSLLILILAGAFALPGVAINGPVALLIKLLSERERRKALADSSVKVKGTDVIASHKVLCSVVAFPVMSLVCAIVFRFLMKRFSKTKISLNLLTLLFFVIWPSYSYDLLFPAMIRSSDTAVKQYRGLKARFNLFMKRSRIQHLKETRNDLQKRMTDFVNTCIQQITAKTPGSNEKALVRLETEHKNSELSEKKFIQTMDDLEKIGI